MTMRQADPNSLTNRIVAACTVPRGLSMPELIAATGGHPPSVNATVPLLTRRGRLHRVGTRMVMRYFARLEDAQAYTLVFKAERAQANERKKQRRRDNYNAKRRAAGLPQRAAKPKTPPKPKPTRQQPAKAPRKPKHGPALTGGLSKPKAAGQQSIADAPTTTWPAHVQVQRAPTPRDDRFTFHPPDGWRGELGREWDQRRAA